MVDRSSTGSRVTPDAVDEAGRTIQDLYEQHAALVYGVAYRLTRSRADADDVTQEVFVGLPRAIQSYRGTGSFAGWLRQVTTRLALMHLRRQRTRSEISIRHAETVPDRDPDRLSDIMLENALRALPSELRAVFILKEIEGYSHGEIANLLEISASASAVRLHRARRELRRQLGDENDAHSSDGIPS